jgi:hypothetical protein
MAIFPIGDQRIGIVTNVPTGAVSEFLEPETAEAVLWWDGCVLEMQTVTEQQGATVTTSEIAVVVGPVVGDQIPTVDDAGDPAPMPVSELTTNQELREGGRTYVMRGDAVLQKDIRGRADHVECRAERQEG